MLIGEEITEKVIGASMEAHRTLGPGLLESAYLECLCQELASRGVTFLREVSLPIVYKGVELDCGYRMDLVIENAVVIEIKSVERLMPIHEAQLITYLRLSRLRVGLLINFNVPLLKDGIIRRVL